MRLTLTDGTVLTVDDGPFTITEDHDCFFMSDGWPVVILARFAGHLEDRDGERQVEWA